MNKLFLWIAAASAFVLQSCENTDGIRDEMETFEFDDPMSVFVPKGVRFGPVKVSALKTPVAVVDILTVPTVREAAVRPDFTFYSEWHDQERLGKNGKYAGSRRRSIPAESGERSK